MALSNSAHDKLCKIAENDDLLNVDEPELIDLTESSNSSISSSSPINWSDQDDSFEDNIPLIDLTESSQDSSSVNITSRSLSSNDLSFSSMFSSSSLFLPPPRLPPPLPILNHLPMFWPHQKHILQVNIPLIDLTQSSPIPSPVHI
ncbi:unnamed protein product [Rotaria socialis]|uniref:Uncharacterized protein n=1 Tax=Rotaria socialis TaxID=392032 RepID=A0A818A4J3_9BILA|nr:unnamed protein product [Rotaria socialis]CAF4844923.1 unnamed protein product [Rotaria socialis]